MQTPSDNADNATAAHAFITRWSGTTASELATAQSFVIDLCALLDVNKPHATPEQDYMFERPVTFRHGDGSNSAGRMDCYKRGYFCLESKKLRAASHTKGFDDGLLRAHTQAQNYVRALPASEGRPPFVLVVDVGNVIEVYAEFSQSGGAYTPFPDPRSHRLMLADLARPEVRRRLRQIWLEPDKLNPALISAQVTRQVAALLAQLANALESSQNQALALTSQAQDASENIASYLTRCLFSMFAEDVGLLPKDSFVGLLKTHRDDPATLQIMLRHLWTDMDHGGFCIALAKKVLHFNGKLFKNSGADGYSRLLTPAQIDLLIAAAQANWREVEPAIFGTLLERALSPVERHALGAHYTPRAYVERLVLPTVIEPLRSEWANAQAAALMLAHEAADLEARPPLAKGGTDAASFDRKQLKSDQEALKRHESAVRAKWKEARQQVMAFHHRLCTLRVLDPACGSANFLYVTLEHLKRLEGEVLNQLAALGEAQETGIIESETVTLQQLRGIELNPRAAALAELVLWIGYLQWHIRTQGNAAVAEPVVHDYRNIECRDAVLAWDAQAPAVDAQGQLLTRWDGSTFKTHPVTGAWVPDEAAQVPQWHYQNPRQAQWPQADFIVGNPPFIGNKRMREALGDGYTQALRAAWPKIPESADFVMYWWAHAAALVATGAAQRMGLITTNSLRQTFNRRVVQAALDSASSGLLGGVGLVSASASGGSGAINASFLGGAGAGTAGGLILSKAQKSAPGDTHPSAASGLGAPAFDSKQPVALVFAIPDHPWVDSANGAAVRIAMTVVARACSAADLSRDNAAEPSFPRGRESRGPGVMDSHLLGNDGSADTSRDSVAKWGSDPEFVQQNSGSDPHLAGHEANTSPESGRLLTVTAEQTGEHGEVAVTLLERRGQIHADLTVGANVTEAVPLKSNAGISSPGVKLHGAGFIVTTNEAIALGLGTVPGLSQHIRDYRNGRDLTDAPRGSLVIDLFGLTAEQVRTQFPTVYQWLLHRVKPERDARGTSKDGSGYAKLWWLHGKPRQEMRKQLATLHRYIATAVTAKHRVFQFVDASVLADDALICIASSDAFHLGILSSNLHVQWALVTGSTLENRPRYIKTTCFETFPFPSNDTGLTPELSHRIRTLAEQIDRHRKQVLGLLPSNPGEPLACDKLGRGLPGADFWAFDSMWPPAIPAPAHQEPLNPEPLHQEPANCGSEPEFVCSKSESDPHLASAAPIKASKYLTLTGLYNVLQALRAGRPLSAKEKTIHQLGLVSVLRELHDELDAAVLQAYGWADLTPGDQSKDELLTRLVALNAQRAQAEAQGTVHWLRPDFQNPVKLLSKKELPAQVQQGLEVDFPQIPAETPATMPVGSAGPLGQDTDALQRAWPATLPEQVGAVALLLASTRRALTLPEIEASFKGRGAWKKSLPTLLQTLEAVGRAQRSDADSPPRWRA